MKAFLYKHRYIILGIIILTLFWIVFYNSLLRQQRYIAWDMDGYQYPLDKFLFNSMEEGEYPLYDPYIYNGMNFSGNIQNAQFYLPKIIFFISLIVANIDLSYTIYQLFSIAHILIFSIIILFFTYKYTRSYSLSMLLATLIPYSGFVQANMQHFYTVSNLTWIPLIAVGMYEYFINRKVKYLILFVVGSVLTLSGGFPHLYIAINAVLILILINYIVFSKKFRNFTFLKGLLKRLILSYLFVFLVSGIILIPFLKDLLTSASITTTYTDTIDYKSIATYVLPDIFGHLSGNFTRVGWDRTNTYFFMGIILLPVIILALLNIKKILKSNLKVLIIPIVFTFIIAHSDLTYLIRDRIKFVNLLRPHMMTIVLGLIASVVAILILLYIRKNLSVKHLNLFRIFVVLSGLSLFINMPGFFNTLDGSSGNINESVMMFGDESSHNRILKTGMNRIVLVNQNGLAGFFDNWGRIFKIRMLGGHDPLVTRDYLEKLKSEGDITYSGRRLELKNLPNLEWLMDNGVNYFITNNDRFEESELIAQGLSPIFKNPLYTIYEFGDSRDLFSSDCARIDEYDFKNNYFSVRYSTATPGCEIRSTRNIDSLWSYEGELENVQELDTQLGFTFKTTDNKGEALFFYENIDLRTGAIVTMSGVSGFIILLILFRLRSKPFVKFLS